MEELPVVSGDEPAEIRTCVNCKKTYVDESGSDIYLCGSCDALFDTDLLWKLHDKNELDALDFNESETFREKFRIKKVK